jgi:hypothetical protein
MEKWNLKPNSTQMQHTGKSQDNNYRYWVTLPWAKDYLLILTTILELLRILLNRQEHKAQKG